MGKRFEIADIFRSKACSVLLIISGFLIILHFLSINNPNRRREKSLGSSLSAINFDVNYVQTHLLELDQADTQLIQYVRVRHLTPPSGLPYKLSQPRKQNSAYRDKFSKWVAEFYKNKRNGIFIEAGANEGERASHTLYLEKALGWTGLLIECNPTVVPYLKSKHRYAWVADVCLAPSANPGILNFSNPTNWTYSGTLKKPWKIPITTTEWKFFDVETFPLYTVLAAVGYTEIDYFRYRRN